ncbi:sensor histidine kinase [Rickettsiales endosymbiont of Peranema trichophorum]|uniref:sensor histidine kinase n=1 Tax=Rickettsiales endosymbiont of Peranema trichophorum TaxID=2486577 RepID=UPI001A90F40D|nr:HAMP domain-containing sensor histidine kinase [Rickettsiales endosymbiont of Peranema trichophorum]
MFSHFRNGTTVLYILVGVLLVSAVFYFKSYMLQNVIHVPYQEHGKELAYVYKNTIWRRYFPVVGYLSDKPSAVVATYNEYASFKDETTKFFDFGKLVKIAVYLQHNKVFFEHSVKGILAGSKDSGVSPSSVQETGHTSYITTARFTDGKDQHSSTILKVLIPISVDANVQGFEELSSKATGVLELNYDVTSEVTAINRAHILMLVTVLSVWGAIALILFVYIRRFERILEQQEEKASDIAAAKASIESESKDKSMFLANMSHELRTPLNAIIGFSEIIEKENFGPIGHEKYKEFITDIHTSGLHLLELIEDILDFSKADEGKLQLAVEPVDLTKMVKVTLRMITPRAETGKITLKDETENTHIVINADSKRLKQVLLNILSNAVKFTPEYGSITVRLGYNKEHTHIVIEIIDTGVGMEAQDIAMAMTPFAQVDNKLSRKYTGTGLGLPLTKKLVELMSGVFEIKSEIGIGTTVVLTFPVSPCVRSDGEEKG